MPQVADELSAEEDGSVDDAEVGLQPKVSKGVALHSNINTMAISISKAKWFVGAGSRK